MKSCGEETGGNHHQVQEQKIVTRLVNICYDLMYLNFEMSKVGEVGFFLELCADINHHFSG